MSGLAQLGPLIPPVAISVGDAAGAWRATTRHKNFRLSASLAAAQDCRFTPHTLTFY